MSRIITLLVVSVFLIGGSTAAAQIAGDGSGQPQTPQRDAQRAASTFEGYGYLIAGLATPSGAYGSSAPFASTIEEAYAEGRSASSGYFVEMGGNRPIWQSTSVPVGVGLSYGFSFSLFDVDWPGLYGINDDTGLYVEEEGLDAVLDVRLGPSVGYQPMPGLVVEASVKFGPGISMLQGATLSDSETYIYDSFDDEAPVAVGLRSSFGVGVGFGPLMGGLEVHRGNASYDRFLESEGGYLPYTAEVGMNATRLYLGLRF